MTDLKTVVNADAGTSDLVGGNDWDSLVGLLNSTGTKQYNIIVSREGSTYTAKDDGWDVISSNSTGETVLQAAIDNAPRGGTVALKGSYDNWFVLTDQISMVNKNVHLTGMRNNGTTEATSSTGTINDYGGVFIKKDASYTTAEPLIDITNTTFTKNSISNVGVIGNNTTNDTGIKFYRGRGRCMQNLYVTGFYNGIEMDGFTDSDLYSIESSLNLNYGMYWPNTTSHINATRFFGGSIKSNPLNLYVAASGGNDVQFFGTEFEGANSGYVHAVQIENGANDIKFYGCSFEKNQETTPVVIYDNGNNNSYICCRFDSDVSYTPIEFRSSAKNNIVNNCFFQTNTASTTQSVLIDSGAQNISFLFNKKSVNTSATVTLTDGGTNTRLIGNSQMGTTWFDKFPATVLFNDFVEQKAVSAPSSPATGFIRVYPKTIDSNNDALFIKRRLNGAVVEIQVA